MVRKRTKNSNSLANKVFPDISNTPTNELGDRDIQLLLKTGYVEKPQYFGTFTIFAEKSKIDRDLIRYQKYGGNVKSSVLNSLSQKESFSQLIDQVNSRNQKQEISNLKSNSTIRKNKGPTLEAVLNYSSIKNLNIPTVLPKIKSSVTKNLKQLTMFDKIIPVHEISRLEHATCVGREQLSSRYRDNSKELNDNIQKFESILEDEKKFYTQPLYYQGHIITRRSPPRQTKVNETNENDDFEEQFRQDIENYQLMKDYNLNEG